jgi:hypothetical protein
MVLGLNKRQHLQQGSTELTDMPVSLSKLLMKGCPNDLLRPDLRNVMQPLRQPRVHIEGKR